MPSYYGDFYDNDFFVRAENTDDHSVNTYEGADTIETGAGNDAIDPGVGADQVKSGAGDDTIYIDAEDTLIDGGEGYDIVHTGWNGANINFTDANFADIEEINLGSGNEWDASALIGDSFFGIQGLSGEHVANATDTDNELVIKGDAFDSVDLDEASFNVASPFMEGYELFGDGELYDIYEADNGAMVAIDADIQIL